MTGRRSSSRRWRSGSTCRQPSWSAAQTASNLGLTRTTRFINVLELGLVRNGSNATPTQRGWEISVELPLFDWGDARLARAEAVYMQAVDRAAETAINARSEVREAYGAYRSAYDIALHHRDELVPLRKLIAEENVLRYNGMLIGVFELLADARLQIGSVNSYIESLRDFWIAQADLEMALIGKPGLAGSAGAAMSPAADAGRCPLNAMTFDSKEQAMSIPTQFSRRRRRHCGSGFRDVSQPGRDGCAARADDADHARAPCRRWCQTAAAPTTRS